MSHKPSRPQTATSFDVAQRAGVSRAVVSRAFTPGSSISDQARKKVLEAANELGYRVNHMARALNQKRSDLVGLIVSNLTNPYRAEQIDALSKHLVAKGYRPMLFCIDDANDTEQSISLLLNYNVSGVVVTSGLPPEAICAECANRHVPLVIIDRGHQYPNVDHVTSDNEGGGRRAAEILLSENRKNLVLVEPEQVVFSVSARADGFKRGLAEAGQPCTILTVPDSTYESGQAAAEHFARSDLETAGVFCPTDLCALGFLDAMRVRHGARVPQDLSIIGYDDIPQAAWEAAQLTTFRQSVHSVAASTVELLESRFDDPASRGQRVVLPVELIRRGTTL